MPPVYLLEADQVPQPMTLASLPDPAAVAPANPLTHTPFSPGVLSHYPLNQDSRRNELIAILGGGAVAVGQGLALSDGGGLNLSVSAGAHNNGGWVYQSAAQTLPLPNNVYNVGDLTVRLHIWLSRTGDLSYRTDLTQPASPSTYLGSARTNGGSIFDLDYSGRVELNAIPYRRTADAGEPNDTLPANWRGLARTAGGLYWWDGSDYIPSMDARTVLVSLGHDTAGALEDVTVAGAGIALAVVETSPGVWQLQISFDPETATGIPLVTSDSPPNLLLRVPRGGEALHYVSWGVRGSFISDGVSANHALFTVQAQVGDVDGLDPGVLGPLTIEDVGYAYANANEHDTGPGFVRSGAGTLLRIRDYSPAPGLAEQNGSIDVTVHLQLTGLGWVDGAEPEDGVCVVTEIYSVGPAKLEFTKVVTITPGGSRRYRCDFHLRGIFADDFSVRIQPDQEGVACSVLDSNRMVQGDSADPEALSGAFDFDLQTAFDTPAGDYGGTADISLRFVVTGPGFRVVNPVGAITLTEDTYDYGAPPDIGGKPTYPLAAFYLETLGTFLPDGIAQLRNAWMGGMVCPQAIGGDVAGTITRVVTTFSDWDWGEAGGPDDEIELTVTTIDAAGTEVSQVLPVLTPAMGAVNGAISQGLEPYGYPLDVGDGVAVKVEAFLSSGGILTDPAITIGVVLYGYTSDSEA